MDFNALFLPMQSRGGIIQFDNNQDTLKETDRQLIDEIYADQQGASYFFVVARASPSGTPEHNRTLSKGRAEAVMSHLRERFDDPELDRKVGLLWLGKEYAQLGEDFCDWRRSGDADCGAEAINRSAFIAWIDCRL
jgi:outer membrane protein OmpA-like peptidoglycan-associated protein